MDAGQRPVATDFRGLVLGFTLGVLAVHALRELPPLQTLVLIAFAALLPLRWRPILLAFVAGAALTVWQAQVQLASRWPAERHNEELTLRGTIASLPEFSEARDRKGELSQTWRFEFQPVNENLPRIRASWYRTDAQLRGGECWELRLRVKTPHGSLNPGAFDYEAWLFRQGIAATATVKSGEPCTADAGYRVLRLRQAVVEQLRSWLPEHPARPLIAALTVGDDSGLSNRDWDVFRLTGTSHLVAISGFNIGIIAGVAFFLFRWLWSVWPPLCLYLPAQKAAMLFSALAAGGYALLAGFEPPVLRAWLMLVLFLLAAWTYRLSQPSSVLAAAWLLILLMDPFAIMSPGLWLSFGAVAAIFYLGTQRRQPFRWLRTFLLLQLFLSLALAPLTLFFFQGTSWAGPLVNLLAVPLFALLTPLLLAAVLLAWLWPGAGIPALGLTADALQLFRLSLDWVVQWPQLWWAASPAPLALALSLIGVILMFAPRGLPLRVLAALCWVPLLFPSATAPKEGVELVSLDVGQGLAMVLRTPNHSLLFDAGPAFEEGFDAGESVVAPYLLSRNVRELDTLMISHEHNDHAGGGAAVRRLLRVSAERGSEGGEPCADGQSWDWDGVHFQILHPDKPDLWSDNNSSCVLRVSYGGRTILLAGDVEKTAEARLLRDHGDDLRADVLIAPHHGSKTSSTENFIAAVQPKIVIHSAGWRHHFHHPHPSVLARYREAGAQQFHTGRQGALSLRLTREGVSEVQAHRTAASRWWNAPAERLE